MLRGLCIFVTAAGLLAATPASAEDASSTSTEHHHDNAVSLHFRSVDSFAEGERHTLMGPVAAYERSLIEGWLEVELSAAALFGEQDRRAYPVEVVFKRPFHLMPKITPYVGAGPALVVHSNEEEHGISPGGVVCAGGHFWSSDSIGIVVELGVGLVAEEEMVREIAGNTGVFVSF